MVNNSRGPCNQRSRQKKITVVEESGDTPGGGSPLPRGARKTRNWDRLMTLNETIFNANFGVSQRVTTGAFSEIYIY